MPKKGFKTITIKEEVVPKLDNIAKELHKSIPETIEHLTDLFSQYTDLLKILDSPDGPTTEDLLRISSKLQKQEG